MFREQRVPHLSFADAAILAVARDRSARAIAYAPRDEACFIATSVKPEIRTESTFEGS